jgi:hypothetical protein
MKSLFLSNIHHAYAQTDGTYAFPNSREGDMLKTAKREIENLHAREKMCETMDKAEKLALIRALQEIRDAVGLLGDGVSPREIEAAVRAFANAESDSR